MLRKGSKIEREGEGNAYVCVYMCEIFIITLIILWIK